MNIPVKIYGYYRNKNKNGGKMYTAENKMRGKDIHVRQLVF
jgi:hypothetical protein